MHTRAPLPAALALALSVAAAFAGGCAPRGMPIYSPMRVPPDDNAEAQASNRLNERQYCADLANWEHARLERSRSATRALAYTSAGLFAAGGAVLVGNAFADGSSTAATVVGTSLLMGGAAAVAGVLIGSPWSFDDREQKIKQHLEAARDNTGRVPRCSPSP